MELFTNINTVFDAYDIDYVADLLREGNVRYTRNGKSIQELLTQRREVPKSETPNASSTGSIRHQDAVVNTDSDNFKKWFGKSKAINKDGTPKVFYHGTDADFTAFDQSKSGVGMFGDGFYFTDSKEDSSGYGENVMPVYLRITNPYTATQKEAGYLNTAKLQKDGYDGIIIKGIDVTNMVVFDPNQIKSADPVTYDDDGNVIPLSERFNEEKSDIRYQAAVDKSGKSSYNEFRTLAMQWANATKRQAGEQRILFDGRRGKYFLIEASDDADMGYIELGNGTLKQMQEEKERYDQSRGEYEKSIEGTWTGQRDDGWYRVNAEYTGEDASDGRLSPRGMEEWTQETDGAGGIEATEEDRETGSGVEDKPRAQTASTESARTILADALMTAASTQEERQKLATYQKNIAALDEMQTRLTETRARIKEISFGKGPRDTQALNNLKAAAQKLEGDIVRQDKRLLTLEATAPLKRRDIIEKNGAGNPAPFSKTMDQPFIFLANSPAFSAAFSASSPAFSIKLLPVFLAASTRISFAKYRFIRPSNALPWRASSFAIS